MRIARRSGIYAQPKEREYAFTATQFVAGMRNTWGSWRWEDYTGANNSCYVGWYDGVPYAVAFGFGAQLNGIRDKQIIRMEIDFTLAANGYPGRFPLMQKGYDIWTQGHGNALTNDYSAHGQTHMNGLVTLSPAVLPSSGSRVTLDITNYYTTVENMENKVNGQPWPLPEYGLVFGPNNAPTSSGFFRLNTTDAPPVLRVTAGKRIQ